MNSTQRDILLTDEHMTAAVEEYLHRMKLIGEDEQVSVGPYNPLTANTTLVVRKEGQTLH